MMLQDKPSSYNEVKAKSSRGIKWVGIAEVFIRIFQWSTTVALARVLTPQDMGLIGLMLVFTQFAYVLFAFGFSTALIQKKETTALHFSSTFGIYLVSAFIYILILVLAAEPTARFYNLPILESLLYWLAPLFLLYALNAMPRILLQKQMHFKKFGILQIISVLAYGIVTLAALYLGSGIWSFVYGLLAEQIILTILLNIFAWWRPSLKFDKKIFKEIVKFSGNVLSTRIIAYFSANLPALVIGKLIGATALGYYNLAYQLVEFPVQRVSKNILRVMFPAFSKLQDDEEGYKKLYQTTVYYLVLILLPVFVGLILIAPQVVEFIYGEKWLPAVLPLQILTAAAFCRSLLATTTIVFLSKGVPETELKINIWYTFLSVPFIIAASYLGLMEVTIILSLLNMLLLIASHQKVKKIIHLSGLRLVKSAKIPILGVILFTFFIKIIQYFNFSEISLFLQLAIIIASSILIYAFVIIKLEPELGTKIKEKIFRDK